MGYHIGTHRGFTLENGETHYPKQTKNQVDEAGQVLAHVLGDDTKSFEKTYDIFNLIKYQ